MSAFLYLNLLVASASGMYAALPSLRGLVQLLWSLLSSFLFFCLVLSLVASATGIDGEVRSLIQPSWPSATSLVSAVIITSVLAYLCTSAATVVCPRACTILVVVTVNAHGSCWTLGY